jgi:hypothetical protein
MKKMVLGLVLLTSINAFSQSNPDNISGEVGRPMDLYITPVFKGLIARIHTLEIEEKVYQMQKNGVTSQEFVAAFNAEGALLYGHETVSDFPEIFPDNKSGRNSGFQLIPYKISITEDNRIYISSSVISLKNMISKNAEWREDRDDIEAFEVIDNIDFLKIEYNKNYNYSNMEDIHFKFFDIGAKVNIIPELPDNQYLAIKAGAAPLGHHKTQVKMVTNDIYTIEGFESSIRYGIEYNINLKKGWRINAEVMASNVWSWDQSREIDEKKRNDYNSEVSYFESNSIYYNPTELKDKYSLPVKRSLFVVTPKVEISKKISKEKKSPKRLGMRVSGNLPIYDHIEGAKNIDLKINNNRNLINAGIFLNF